MNTQSSLRHFWIMGPTASGKSSLSLKLAKEKECEIISVDSALVYKGLEIGAAKPSRIEQNQVKHHLIDICNPWKIYDVSQFCNDAIKISKQIESKYKTPIFSGGTFLYFRSLEYGLSNLPKSNKTIQKKWQKLSYELGAEYLHQKLAEIDLPSSEKFHPNDSQRIIRALTIFEQTGATLSNLLKKEKRGLAGLNYSNPMMKVALLPETESLKQKIASRFHQMIEMGLVNEVEKILKKITNLGISKQEYLNLPAIKSIGYQQVSRYLLDEINYQTMIEKTIIASNQLAKRQRTWLRSEKNIHIFSDEKSALQFLLKN